LLLSKLKDRLEYPVGYGKQDYYIGKPLYPAQLKDLPLAQRKQFILDSMNTIGADLSEEKPNPANPTLAQTVDKLSKQYQIDPAKAAVAQALKKDQRGRLLWNKIVTKQYEQSAEDQWLVRFAQWLFEKV
jgi:hypothetical protein